MNVQKITTKEINSFVITVVFYLAVSSLAVYFFRIPAYVSGILLGVWTLAVFSFEFNVENIKKTFYDSIRLIVGLTPPYLVFMGTPHFFSIFKWYLFTLFLGTFAWVVYKMGMVNKEKVREAFLETIEGERDEKSQ